MKKFIDFVRSPDFKRFVKIRRIWFGILLASYFWIIASRVYDGDFVIGDIFLITLFALVASVITSLVTIPLVALMAWITKGLGDE